MSLKKIILIALSIVSIHLVACSNQEFAGSSGQRFAGDGGTGRGGPGDQDDERDTKEKRFSIEANRGPVDILWLIDTSGSMREETDNVKRNFSSFLTNLARQTSAKLTLVAKNTEIQLSREALDSGHVQINQTVASTDALVIARDLLKNGSVALRDGARFVVVVVTDDNAAVVTDRNFLDLLEPAVQSKNPVLFAFRGDVSKPNCKVANKGVAYENLAKATGGQVFDICDQDWTPNFNKLVSSVESIANSSFKLQDPNFLEVSKVLLDGLLLEPRDYAVIDGELRLIPALISPTSKEIVVKYKVKP